MLVVAGNRAEAGNEVVHEGLPWGEEGGVDVPLVTDGDRALGGVAGRAAGAEAAEAVGGQEQGVRVEGALRAGAVPLRAGQVAGEPGVHEVGAPDGAVEQAAAAEQRGRLAGRAHQERLVVAGVAGGGDHLDREAAVGDDVAVADAQALEAHPLVGREQVVGAVATSQPETSRHVVVVQVGVGDAGDVDLGRLRRPLHGREVPRRVDHDPDAPVVHEVAAVAEAGHLDDDDRHVVLLGAAAAGSVAMSRAVRGRTPEVQLVNLY